MFRRSGETACRSIRQGRVISFGAGAAASLSASLLPLQRLPPRLCPPSLLPAPPSLMAFAPPPGAPRPKRWHGAGRSDRVDHLFRAARTALGGGGPLLAHPEAPPDGEMWSKSAKFICGQRGRDPEVIRAVSVRRNAQWATARGDSGRVMQSRIDGTPPGGRASAVRTVVERSEAPRDGVDTDSPGGTAHVARRE